MTPNGNGANGNENDNGITYLVWQMGEIVYISKDGRTDHLTGPNASWEAAISKLSAAQAHYEIVKDRVFGGDGR